MSEPLLSLYVRSLRSGDRTILREVALRLHAGEVVGVAGHVGAGKSTLGLLAAGLLDHDGDLKLDGRVDRSQHAGAAAGYVFADPWTQLTGWGGTVREEIAIGPENLAVPQPGLGDLVDDAMQRARVKHLAHRAPHTLSGGELQRVALASALAMRAPLLVLDEPASQLDPEAVREMAELVRGAAAAGQGVLLVEQHLELLLSTCDRVLVLADGALLAEGDPPMLLEHWPPLDSRIGAPPHIVAEHAPPLSRATPGTQSLLTVRDLTAGYGDVDVLRGLSLELVDGAVSAWMGPNGAGKSTLARVIMGLLPPRRGSIDVAGTPLDPLPAELRARHVGLVFQDPGRQLFSPTVMEEVMFGPRAHGWSRAIARDAAREALEIAGLDRVAGEHPGDLPPQRRRLVAIAAAMAVRPPLLILDEPTAGQDAAGREAIARVLEAQRRRGSAAVITHDAWFARRHADFAHHFVPRGSGEEGPASSAGQDVPDA